MAAGRVDWGITLIELPETVFWVDGAKVAESSMAGFVDAREY
jgi:hypothetical protein